MAYDLEEQEQLAAIKAWWAKFGNGITGLVLLIALGFAGVNGWNWYQLNQAAQAAQEYEALQIAVTAKDAGAIRDKVGILLEKYSRTAYAQMGALSAARANVDAGDLKTAKAQLEWTVEHARSDEYRWIARLRLAGILLDEGAYDEAAKQLSGDVPADFQAAFADRRGDLFVAQNKLDDARREYQAAFDKLNATPAQSGGYANIVQLKLDALGSGIVASAAPAAAAPAAAASATIAAPMSAQPEKK